jgi:hypothetical protein
MVNNGYRTVNYPERVTGLPNLEEFSPTIQLSCRVARHLAPLWRASLRSRGIYMALLQRAQHSSHSNRSDVNVQELYMSVPAFVDAPLDHPALAHHLGRRSAQQIV